MNKKINIVTGKIHSGKITRLFTFKNSLESVDGILAPIINDRRMLYHISSRTMKEFEVDVGTENIIDIGKYHFLENSFNWANKKLIESYLKIPDYLIIDEIGKLELIGKGLNESFKYVIEDKLNLKTKIVIVVRDSLLNEVIEFYELFQEDYDLLDI